MRERPPSHVCVYACGCRDGLCEGDDGDGDGVFVYRFCQVNENVSATVFLISTPMGAKCYLDADSGAPWIMMGWVGVAWEWLSGIKIQ